MDGGQKREDTVYHRDLPSLRGKGAAFKAAQADTLWLRDTSGQLKKARGRTEE